MSLIERAEKLVSECEEQIRALIESALANRQYEDIARLAALASGLSALTVQSPPRPAINNVEHEADRPIGEFLADSVRTEPVPAQAINLSPEQYPRFEREGDRLIKLGWSKQNRAVYEHKAPIEIVRAVAAKLVSTAKRGGHLRMDEVLPVDSSEGEVPSYQAYLVLGWLREMGAVNRLGNDGYKLVEKRLDDEKVEDLWLRTPERA